MKIQTAIMIFLAGLCFSNSGLAWQDRLVDQGVIEQVEDEAAEQEGEGAAELVEAVPMAFGAGDMEEQFTQSQTQAAHSELNQLKDHLNLDDQWVEKLKGSIEEDIKSVAKKLAQDANTNVSFGFDSALDTELRQTMWKKAEEALPEGNEAAFDEFKKMVLRLQQLSDETAVKGVIVFLDNQLCLSQKQVDDLKKSYSKNWNSAYNEQVGSMAFNGMVFGRGPIDMVAEEEFEKVLSAEQFEIYKELEQSPNFMMAMQMGAMEGEDGISSAKIRSQCDQALDLKIAEYEALVGLTDKQRKMLGVARKGAASKVVNRMEGLFENAEENLNMMGMNMEVMEQLMEPVVSQCTREAAWQKTIGKVFDEEQFAKIEARETSRRDMAKDQVVNYMIFAMVQSTDGLSLSYEQHVQLAELIKEKLGDSTLNYLGVAMEFFKVSDDEFQEIMTQEQWELFGPMLEAQRGSFEEMMGDEEEEDEDDSDESLN